MSRLIGAELVEAGDPEDAEMFALDIGRLEAHERELKAVSRLETQVPSGEIVLMFFHAGEGWSDRAFIECVPASDFAKTNF